MEPTDLVWKQGMADWVPAHRLKGLFPSAVSAIHNSPAPVPVTHRNSDTKPLNASQLCKSDDTPNCVHSSDQNNGPSSSNSQLQRESFWFVTRNLLVCTFPTFAGRAAPESRGDALIRFKRHPTGKIIAVVSSLLLVLLIFLSRVARDEHRRHKAAEPSRAVGNHSATESTTPIEEAVLMTEFIDNTRNYKDKVIEFEMMFSPDDGRTLRQSCGGVAQFRLIDENASADIAIQVPANLDVPNASGGDEVNVRFDCNLGRLDGGNVAVEIRRP
jgi:hypothetical protein